MKEWMKFSPFLGGFLLFYFGPLIGVFIAGVLEILIPREVVTGLVGRNTVNANLAAFLFDTMMYFATLTKVPIIQKLIFLGMAKEPTMTLFLIGNALSIPGIIVLLKLLGEKKTAVYRG